MQQRIKICELQNTRYLCCATLVLAVIKRPPINLRTGIYAFFIKGRFYSISSHAEREVLSPGSILVEKYQVKEL